MGKGFGGTSGSFGMRAAMGIVGEMMVSSGK